MSPTTLFSPAKIKKKPKMTTENDNLSLSTLYLERINEITHEVETSYHLSRAETLRLYYEASSNLHYYLLQKLDSSPGINNIFSQLSSSTSFSATVKSLIGDLN